MSKLIEAFVRHEPTLPRELKHHLFSIEEKMLEALAWERGSSLFHLLVRAVLCFWGGEQQCKAKTWGGPFASTAGFEPALLSKADFESAALTTRPN